MSAAAKRLIALFLVELQRLMAGLDDGAQTVAAWRQEFAAALARYHTAALLIGQGATTVTPAGRRWLAATVQAQIGFLDQFAVEIQDTDTFMAGWRARAAMYAQGIGASYWRGQTKFLPLPAMPKDGTTQCLTNCGCEWQIDQLDGDGNYDCYWRLGKDDTCQTCAQRARDWAPYKIRNGEVV